MIELPKDWQRIQKLIDELRKQYPQMKFPVSVANFLLQSHLADEYMGDCEKEDEISSNR